MGEKAKMIMNEYTGLGILLRPDFDVNKFYSSDLKVFIKTARKALEDYKTKMDKAVEYIDIFIQCIDEQRTTDKEKIIIGRLKNLKSLLKGDD